MSTIPPVATTVDRPQPVAADAGALGKDDFLKLLIGQMRYQNPLQPTDSQEWIAQLTQYSVLEQLTNLAAAGERAGQQAAVAQAVALLGREVTWTDAEGAAQSGIVDGVTFEAGGAPLLSIGGHAAVAPAAVSEVR